MPDQLESHPLLYQLRTHVRRQHGRMPKLVLAKKTERLHVSHMTSQYITASKLSWGITPGMHTYEHNQFPNQPNNANPQSFQLALTHDQPFAISRHDGPLQKIKAMNNLNNVRISMNNLHIKITSGWSSSHYMLYVCMSSSITYIVLCYTYLSWSYTLPVLYHHGGGIEIRRCVEAIRLQQNGEHSIFSGRS